MRPVRLLLPLAGVAASTLVLSACGSSGGGGGSSSAAGSAAPAPSTAASSTPASSAPESSAAAAAPTQAQLTAIGVQAADLPGYKATPPEADSGDNDLGPQLKACTGVPGAPASHKVASVDSDDFAQDPVTVSSTFNSFRSESDVTADVAQLKSPKINQCLNSTLKASLAKSLGTQGTVTGISVRLTLGSGGGPSNVVALAGGTVDVTANGQQGVIYLGVAFVTGPQVDGTLSYIGIGKQLDTATQQRVLTAVAQRANNP